MYHLAAVFPVLKRLRLPFNRDQAMLAMVAINELFLGLDHYFAHLISGSLRPYEVLPIYFGVIAGTLLIILGILAVFPKLRDAASSTATLILSAGIAVGLLGWFLHLIRTIQPHAPAGHRVTIELFIWAPPILGPLTASMIGLLGIMAVWDESPPGSGILKLPGKLRFPMPLSKTRAYLLLIGLGVLATLTSSVLDHARTGFQNPWLWVSVATGVFGTAVCVASGTVAKLSRADLITLVAALVLLIATGVIGAALHMWEDYVTGGRVFVLERYVRGAPFMAPLLFADMGTLGLIALLDPGQGRRGGSERQA